MIVSGLWVNPRPKEWMLTLQAISISTVALKSSDLLGSFRPGHNEIDTIGIRGGRVADQKDGRDGVG